MPLYQLTSTIGNYNYLIRVDSETKENAFQLAREMLVQYKAHAARYNQAALDAGVDLSRDLFPISPTIACVNNLKNTDCNKIEFGYITTEGSPDNCIDYSSDPDIHLSVWPLSSFNRKCVDELYLDVNKLAQFRTMIDDKIKAMEDDNRAFNSDVKSALLTIHQKYYTDLNYQLYDPLEVDKDVTSIDQLLREIGVQAHFIPGGYLDRAKAELIESISMIPRRLAEQRRRNMYTPLMRAVIQGNCEKVHSLLTNKKADPNIETTEGITALMLAAARVWFGCYHFKKAVELRLKIIELLLDHHAGVDAKDCYDRTPLMHVSVGPTYFNQHDHPGRGKTIEILLYRGADATLTDCKGLSAYDYAKDKDHDGVKLLQDAADKVLKSSKTSATPFWGLNHDDVESNDSTPIRPPSPGLA